MKCIEVKEEKIKIPEKMNSYADWGQSFDSIWDFILIHCALSGPSEK